MAIDFPNAPQLNDVYTFGDRQWTWNGSYWQSSGFVIGYTGSQGLAGSGIIDANIVGDDLVLTYDDSSQQNLGRVVGYTGSGAGGGGGGGEATPVTVNVASQNVESGNRYILIYDGTVELTLPASPAFGATFYVVTANDRLTNVIRRNSHKIMGLNEDLTLDVETASFGLIYVDSTLGWRLL